MAKHKKTAKRPSQALRYRVAKSARDSTATSQREEEEATSPASFQAVRPSRTVGKQHTSPSLSGDECSDASNEYIPSGCTCPSVAAEDESEALANTSEDDDGNTEQEDADTKEESESDDCEPRASKRRKVLSHNMPNPSKSGIATRNVSSNSITGKGGETNIIGDRKIKTCIDASLPPISDMGDVFEDIARKAVIKAPFIEFINHLGGRQLNVATMCSGTESPILAINHIADALKKDHDVVLEINHQFSAEIVPFKQAYIERNFHPGILFRDIIEMAEENEASTAWGAPKAVPADVDILIAGFSCVDFSRLNSRTKTLTGNGESGGTFWAILAYATRFRPRIIVLENVNSAPWKDIKKEWESAEYAAEFVKLDTKQYYIPHTRQRVYMICIDKRNYKSADVGVKEWASLMQEFQRPASCSIEAFLLSDDDPRLHAAQEQQMKASLGDGRGPREVKWSKCRGRHETYRASLQLGTLRPVTSWVEGGSCKMPDFSDLQWSRNQVERIWDTIDISYLRNAAKDFDSHYKSRVWDLSQNIDRFTDTAPFGVTGCLTPTGQPFLTTRGGPLLGYEALKMQGLPTNKLLLTHETPKQLQDLAGNAMSVSVIAIAISSACMVGYPALSKGSIDLSRPMKQLAPDLQALDDSGLRESCLDLTGCRQTLISKLCLQANGSLRLCRCEGLSTSSPKRILVCEQCGHTACEKCAGNPCHFYKDYDQAENQPRVEPHTFETDVKQALPMRLLILRMDSELWKRARHSAIGTIEEGDWKIFMQAVLPACNEELRFHSIKRTNCWTVYFQAPNTYLELVFLGLKAHWYLYVKPDPQQAVNSRVRELLKYPIARMVPDNDNILKGPWEVRLPVETVVPITIKGGGNLTSSWESKLGLQAQVFADKKVWTALQIESNSDFSKQLNLDIAGEYKLLQQCGGASGSLHKRVAQGLEEEPPLYLFLDVEPIGNPRNDRFVFSTLVQRPNCRDARYVTASLQSSWRQSSVEGTTKVKCDVHGEWVHANATLQAFKHTEPATYAVPNEDIPFHLSEGTPAQAFTVGDETTICTGATTAILSCKVPLVNVENIGWRRGPWTLVNETSERLVYTSFSWLTEKVRYLDGFSNEWRELRLPVRHIKCQGCAPDLPSHRWKPVQVGSTTKLVPFEDPRQAGHYERAMKVRVAPFVTYVRIDENKIGRFMIGLNVPTLAHRALAKLPNLTSYDGVKLFWRLDTDYVWPANTLLDKFHIRNNKNDAEALHVFPEEEEVDGVLKPLKLRKEQLRSLSWMLQQEADELEDFLEQEVEEAHLHHLGWRADVRVTRTCKIRGGVLADETGFGKTATTLALIDAQAEGAVTSSKTPCVGAIGLKATLIIVPKHLVPQWREQVTKFLGNKYTVIEVQDVKSLTSQTVRDFKQADIIIVAASIFTSDLYLKNLSLLAALPEAPATAGRALDAWLARATERISEHVEGMKKTHPVHEFRTLLKARLAAAEEDEELLLYMPSKRLRGKDYAAAKEGNDAAQKGKGKKRTHEQQDSKAKAEITTNDSRLRGTTHAAVPKANAASQKANGKKRKEEHQDSEVETENTTDDSDDDATDRKAAEFYIPESQHIDEIPNPIFQMFRFNRVIIDEYTYVDSKSHAYMILLQANSRWVLSASPALEDFADVKTMARFVGVNLGVDDDTVGVMKSDNIRAIQKDRTAAEQFHSCDRQVKSPQWHMQRHEHAQYFLDRFARQNTSEIPLPPVKLEFKAVHLPAAERAIYAELQQLVIAQDMKLREGGRAHIDNDRTRRLNELMGKSKSPEEALLKCSSHFTLPDLESRSNTLLLCDVITQVRKKQYKSLCEEVKEELGVAAWLMQRCKNPNMHYMGWKGHVKQYGLGDPKAKEDLVEMIDTAEAHGEELDKIHFSRDKPKSGAKMVVSEGTGKGRDKKVCEKARELRNLAGHLRRLSDELVSRVRALRFVETVSCVQRWQSDGKPAPMCSYCGCKASAPEKILVLGLCGHLVCDGCLASGVSGDRCVVPDCGADVFDYHKNKATEFRHEDPVVTTSMPFHGKKIAEIIQLIKDIPAEDQVLIFVQFDSLMDQIANALKKHGIKSHALTNKAIKKASKLIQDFQMDTTPAKKKVLLLKSGTESAAGTNLTNANHIIFVSPLLAPTQHQYDQSLTQCIGRAWRYGQKKTVHVYRFLSLKTTDVDILQERSRKKLVEQRRDVFKLMSECNITPEQRDAEWGTRFFTSVSQDIMEAL